MNRMLQPFAVMALLACPLAAGQTAPGHPPTFEDMRRMGRISLEDISDPVKVARFSAFIAALEFTPPELQKIRDSGDVPLLLGAGCSAGVPNNAPGHELLKLAIAKAPKDPLPLAALVCSIVPPSSSTDSKTSELWDALKQWQQLEPENSVPFYLEAPLYAKLGRYDAVARALARATPRANFNSYRAVLRRDVVRAAEFVGYSRFAARYLALASQCGDLQFAFGLTGYLKSEGVDEKGAGNCLTLGKRLEAESTRFIGELVALNIQKLALNKLPAEAVAGEIKRMDERCEYIKKAQARLAQLEAIVPEERFVSYLDDVLATSEAKAYDKLASEHRNSLE